jgi:hypothetical protein
MEIFVEIQFLPAFRTNSGFRLRFVHLEIEENPEAVNAPDAGQRCKVDRIVRWLVERGWFRDVFEQVIQGPLGLAFNLPNVDDATVASNLVPAGAQIALGNIRTVDNDMAVDCEVSSDFQERERSASMLLCVHRVDELPNIFQKAFDRVM